MTRARLIVAHLLIFGVIAGHGYDIVTRQEHWPFSNYPMFSTVHRTRVLRWFRLYGVTDDNREVAIVKYAYLWPLDQSRLPLGLRRVYRREGNGARLREAVADALVRYEHRREAGLHDGPHLRSLRLYQVDWELEPYAANIDRPIDRELLVEVQAGQEVQAAR
jgi:hypothetical protein